MKEAGVICWAFLAGWVLMSEAADWTLQSSTIENSGGWISNTAVSSASVGGQDQPVGISTNALFTSYGGFAYTFVLQPGSDRRPFRTRINDIGAPHPALLSRTDVHHRQSE